ncbi:sigma-54 interaction domain-containing protein [Zavarzinia compransoris]|uniref:sigma-54 interaction domain-containing protein n=1 Tax=Zavarzinia compransoris TaxID=1264899 RepID=UPI001414EABE|nr:sigma-54 dependent transcriptional regulator [Zavarzinia compransoris]
MSTAAASTAGIAGPVFDDPVSRRLSAEIERVAGASVHVLVLGETGVGKELVARQIHQLSARRQRPFIAVNCAALSENLFESELFGHEKGAFTGALSATTGWFEAADGGTLFLDEIGELAPAMQAKLLRVIQQREVTRVGARVSRPIDVRLVTATNVDLAKAITAGRFREDLYYRIKVATLKVPPLRDRPGDILALARHFVGLHGPGAAIAFSPEAEAALLDHDWPGNIRELENVVQAALVGHRGGRIEQADLSLGVRDDGGAAPERAAPGGLQQVLDDLLARETADLFNAVQKQLVLRALDHAGGNQVHAAAFLGITRNVLRTLMQRYDLLPGGKRG